MSALLSEDVDVDDDVCGLLWSVNDLNDLSKLIAVITLGQAQHAARIIHELEPNGPAFSDVDLYAGARGQMRIRGSSEAQREVSRYHRDGFLFECISWITARQSATDRTFLKDPHISSTTQGLDGLSIRMHPVEPVVVGVTIFEDKCTDNPRDKFRDEIMPTFTEHHGNKRSRDLVANAVSLIKEGGLNGTEAARAASRVLDKQYRTYRAALTVDSTIAAPKKRKKLFNGYNNLTHIKKGQRVGAMLVIDGDLRDWFQDLANNVISALNEFEAEDV
ncbi:hypothetical protein LZ337_12985 [Serratia marcescens]|uniref:hypothetical protein n=1 Tax=Serratia marcescens TaxID=615 RepID=UPI001F064D10|nr:hypothetical protein [Serratia marcescens]MDM1787144.1 hypothetical protein [Serratia marcescens]MDM1794436.1 hypothetical protein [Serratia marcescens]MDM1800502.1 hypothetical protein [Serratia marcescens]MDM1806206.1 hypothetical protein [Serratia marcescens]MDM1809718.1 hypothetical protein [Serratia marcescens]